MKRPDLAARNYRHGHAVGGATTKEYRAWSSIRWRCNNLLESRYGGRGIQMCQRWRESFAAFLEDVGSAPTARHQIDRIDNDGHYEPGNVRWTTSQMNNRNRGNTLLASFNGETRPVKEWAERTGIGYWTLRIRLAHGWPVDRALTEAVDTRKGRHARNAPEPLR